MDLIQEKNSRNGVIGTILFHLLLLLLFIQFGMTYQDPPEENAGGMIINFGTTDEGMGDVQPSSTENSSSSENTTQSEATTPSSAQENALTTAQESVEINASQSNTTSQQTTTQQQTEPTVDPNLTNALNALNNSNNTSTSDGNSNTVGDQGDPNGNPNSSNYVGGNSGNGVDFSLVGRSMVKVKKPNNPTQEEGKVVVEIVVDKNGKVVRATPGARGSNTTNATLYKIAKEAALEARFNAKADAMTEQKGTMTFVFILN